MRYAILLFCCLSFSNSCKVETSSEKEVRNIIFLLTDDQRDNSFAVWGHPFVQTPHTDALIKKSVRFSNTYISEPTCSPSRISFFTGLRERVNGVGFTSSYQINEEQWAETYPALLRKNGYYTGFVGKFGVEYYTFRGQAHKKFDYWRGHDGWAKFFPKIAKNCKAYHDSKYDIITPIMGESIERFLTTRDPQKPFCLSVSFSIPHGSQTRSMYNFNKAANLHPKLKNHPIYGNLYRNLKISIPDDTAKDPYRYIPKKIMNQNKGRNKTYHYNYSIEKCEEQHIRYYQQITGIDKVIGDMIASLKKKNLYHNTVIIFTSDHGLLMGEYGMGGKGLLYDLVSKIPCFIFDPSVTDNNKPNQSVHNLVSSLDITSTILDYAGVKQPKYMEGMSLRALLNDRSVKWRDTLFLNNLYTGRDTPFSEGIRQGKWKYIRMYDGVTPYKEKHLNFSKSLPDFEQLFDLEKDPKEKNNLIDQYENSPLLMKLRESCEKEAKRLNKKREQYKKTQKITRK